MKCVICGMKPDEIEEYLYCEGYSGDPDWTPEAMAKDDGTYNEELDIFCCTSCYVTIGMPLGRAKESWRTTPFEMWKGKPK